VTVGDLQMARDRKTFGNHCLICCLFPLFFLFVFCLLLTFTFTHNNYYRFDTFKTEDMFDEVTVYDGHYLDKNLLLGKYRYKYFNFLSKTIE